MSVLYIISVSALIFTCWFVFLCWQRFTFSGNLFRLRRSIRITYSNRRQKIKAIKYLEKYGNRRAVIFLIRLLGDMDKMVRYTTQKCLNNLATKDQICKGYIQALNSEFPDAREEAVEELGKLRYKQAFGPLMGKIGDEDSGVRAAIKKVLNRLATQDQLFEGYKNALAISNRNAKKEIIYALEEFKNERAVSLLVQCLYDTEIQLYALEALSNIDHPEANTITRLAHQLERQIPKYKVPKFVLIAKKFEEEGYGFQIEYQQEEGYEVTYKEEGYYDYGDYYNGVGSSYGVVDLWISESSEWKEWIITVPEKWIISRGQRLN